MTAATLAEQIDEAHGRGAMHLLENLGVAAILLNRLGKVVQATQRATSLMCSDFCIKCERISIAHRQASVQLDDALRRVLNSNMGTRVVGPVSIARESKRPLILHVVAVGGPNAAPPASPGAIVLAKDPDLPRSLMPDDCLHLLALTPAEANLATLLCSGSSLVDAADHLRITAETARTRLKSIFSKTNTHKQTALIALLLQMATPL